MVFLAMAVLAFGPLNWSFPWWLWVLAVLHASGEGVVTLKKASAEP